MRLVARCLRGIEWICAAELAAAGAHVEAVEHRLVECRAAPGPALLGAGTVDDLFLLGLRLTGAGRQRTALAEVRAQVERLEAGPLLAAVEAVRPLPADAPFEVVASFLGRRNSSRFEVERAGGRCPGGGSRGAGGPAGGRGRPAAAGGRRRRRGAHEPAVVTAAGAGRLAGRRPGAVLAGGGAGDGGPGRGGPGGAGGPGRTDRRRRAGAGRPAAGRGVGRLDHAGAAGPGGAAASRAGLARRAWAPPYVRSGSRLIRWTMPTRTQAPITATMKEAISPVAWIPRSAEMIQPPTRPPMTPRITSTMTP